MEKGEQFLLLSTIFCYLKLDFYVKRKIRFSLRDKRLFEITEVDCSRKRATVLAVDAGRGCLVIFHSPIISLFFLHLSERRLDIDRNTVSKSWYKPQTLPFCKYVGDCISDYSNNPGLTILSWKNIQGKQFSVYRKTHCVIRFSS